MPSITVLNDVTDTQLAYLYRHAVCLVSPSLMEGFGLIALEALALKCIPVVSDIPAFHEVCEDAALYFNPTSPKSLREKLEYVLVLDKKAKERLQEKGQERLKQFSWRDMANQTLEIYESCSSTRSE